jgi:hypothetical protein
MKNQIRNVLFEGFNEREEPFFYLAPDIVGSVAGANMNMDKNVFSVDFMTTDGRNMTLKVKNDSANNWFQKNEGEDFGVYEFVKDFISKSKPEEELESDTLDEIVDEYGDIMGDDDMPNNANDAMIGKSKFGSEKAIKQTIPKSKRYYGDLGLGVITW